jgi:hypothetical protein
MAIADYAELIVIFNRLLTKKDLITQPHDFGMRVDNETYLGLPEGHRTTYVVGLIDMLDWVGPYLVPERKATAERLLRFARPLRSEELGKMLDSYVKADAARNRFAASSSFVAALKEKMASGPHTECST